jgi:hypothetical protein
MGLSKMLAKAKAVHLPADPADRGRAIMERVRDALAAAGLPRTSRYAGGEITGWTTSMGSTGFSLQVDGIWHPSTLRFVPSNPPRLRFHVVVSGKQAGLRYKRYTERVERGRGRLDFIELHEPIEPERLIPKIRKVLEGLGFEVAQVTVAGAQTHWDDDVMYNVVTDWPEWVGRPPEPRRR